MSKMAFYVNGNGEMQVKRNGISVGTATSTVTLTDIEFVNGDTLGMLLVPYTGSSLIKLCDFPQTECTTDLSYSYPIINAPLLPQMMIATFTTLTPFSVNVIAAPSSTTIGNKINFTATPTGGTAPYAYSWSGACTGTSQTCAKVFTLAGTYTASVKVTDSTKKGYMTSVVATVTASPLSVTATASSAITTTGKQVIFTATASGGTEKYYYSWTGACTGSLPLCSTAFTTTGTKTATVTVTDSGGNIKVVSVSTVVNISTLSVTAAYSGSAVVNATVNFTATPNGGTAPYTYSWSGACTGTSQTCATLFATTGTKTATVTVTDANGSNSSAQVSVEIKSSPTSDLSVAVSVSPNPATTEDIIAFTATPSGGVAPYTYNWSGLCNATTATCQTLYSIPGTYSSTIKVTDSAGSTKSVLVNVVITLPALSVTVTASSSSVVAGNTVIFTAVPHGGKSPYRNYVWSEECTASGTSATTCSTSFATGGVHTVKVTVMDSAGKTASYSVSVEVSATPPELSATATVLPSSAAIGDSVTFIAWPAGGTPPFTYLWTDDCSGPSQNCSTSFATPGVYSATVYITDAKSATVHATASITINSASISNVIVSSDSGYVVNGGNLQMAATILPATIMGASVIWSVTNETGSATINASTGLLNATGVGTVTVTATAPNGVLGTIKITVTPTTVYSLTITPIKGIGTTAVGNPFASTYDPNTVLTIKAEPTPGYVFDHWSGDLSGNTNPETITMDANKTIVANFVPAS